MDPLGKGTIIHCLFACILPLL
uniref:Uncharacterized protein n=1 Tax=Arundo donax TaxID=35708 RepID=A0A0A9GSR9_ARUDO